MSGPTHEEIERLFGLTIPNGSASYVGLFVTMPNGDGTGGTEVSDAWYSRKSHSAWRTDVVGGVALRRVNTGAVEMPAHSGSDTVIKGWGIWDAATDGNLRHFGPLRTAGGVEVVGGQTLSATDQLRWVDGSLIAASWAHTTDQTKAVIMEKTFTGSTDGTPSSITLGPIFTLADGEGVTIDAVFTAVATGGAFGHYSRRVRIKAHRDDGGSGTVQWGTIESDAEGQETRDGLTAATATLEVSGNSVQGAADGETGKALDWIMTVTVRSDTE